MPTCHILVVRLLEVGLPVWRRLRVRSEAPLSTLHLALQAVVGWENVHLHEFVVGDRRFGPLEDDDGEDLDLYGVESEDLVTIAEVLPGPGASLRYVYDWGDEWWHAVDVLEVVPVDETERWATCLEGEGSCPPEDCGGPSGFADLLRDPPEGWKPARFSSKAASRRLGTKPTVAKGARSHHPAASGSATRPADSHRVGEIRADSTNGLAIRRNL